MRVGLAALRRARLLRPAFRAWERWQAWSTRTRGAGPSEPAADGLPLPPQRLIVLVAGPTSAETFLRKGRLGADTVRDALRRQGVELETLDAILDFGVGCGRVARHWQGLRGPRVHGCDVNAELVAWTVANLPFVTATRTGLAPPLPYADESFDAVYSYSVFTHLPEDLGLVWARDLRRVVRRGGHLVLSTHGAAYLDRLDARERAAFAAGELVVHFEELAGANLCSAFHPPAYVRARLADGLTAVEHRPEGAPSSGRQDLWVLRR